MHRGRPEQSHGAYNAKGGGRHSEFNTTTKVETGPICCDAKEQYVLPGFEERDFQEMD